MTQETFEQFSARVDSYTVEQFRAAGGLKWSAYPEALGAWVAEMDFGLAPAILATFDDFVAKQLTGYLPGPMRLELRQATSKFAAKTLNWQIDPAMVTWLPDVLTGLGLTLQQFVTPNSKVILPTPCYMPFTDVPRAFGHEVIEVPMVRQGDGWVSDEDALAAAFRAGGELLILCNPHNPIGKVYTREELESLCVLVDRYGGKVFSDEIHAPLTFPGHQHISYASINDVAAGHTITSFAASKAWNIAGLKCAQLVCNPRDTAQLRSYGHGLPHEPSTLGTAATIAAYRDGHQWLGQVLTYLERNRDLVLRRIAEGLPEVDVVTPQGTFLAWLDVRGLGLWSDPSGFFRRSCGVALTDGADCGEAGRGHVRLNFATPTPVLNQILDQMIAGVRKQ